jgi:gliding motility-associated-like protein
MKKIAFLIVGIICGLTAWAQEKSNKGTEFWLGYGYNVLFNADFPINNQRFLLYLSADEATTVTISVNATGWSQTLNIPANTVNTTVEIPKAGADDARIQTEGLFDRAIHIVSTKPIVVYAHQFNAMLSGATLLFPVETYGYSYYSVNYRQPAVGGTPGKNWCYAIASEDNTRLQITPTDSTEGGWLPGVTYTVNLNKGQLYNFFGKVTDEVSKDITGSKIVSVPGSDGKCHPIAVFSGNSRFILCATDGGEVAHQQLFPASAWGTRYLTFHSMIATTNPLTTPFLNFFRVMVTDPATVVKRNGVVMTGLINNRFYEFESTSGDYIEADLPVLVCQYTPNSNQCTGNSMSPIGDPELMFLPPVEQGLKKARVYYTRNNSITVCYLTIIIPTAGISSLRINGTAVSAAQQRIHPANPNYTVVARRLLGAASQVNIESDSAFSAMIYGAGTYESYGYIAGTLINNLNAVGTISNSFNTTGLPNSYTCPKSPFTINVKIAYRATSLQWLLSQVPGLQPATDTLVTNPQPTDSTFIGGRKFYSYQLSMPLTLADTGTHYIPIRYTSAQIDHCSQQEETTLPIVVKAGPIANFSSQYKGCNTDTAFLTGLPDVNNYSISAYTWQYAGLSDTAQQVAFVPGNGNHPVYLKAIATNGCVGDTTQTIVTFPEPVARFGIQRSICAGDSVLYTDSANVASGSIAEWRWDFGTTTLVTTANTPFYVAYNNADTFTTRLQVSSDKGCLSDTFAMDIVVKQRPLASIGYVGLPCTDSLFVFTPNVNSNGSNILKSTWLFGDGDSVQISSSTPVTHSYAVADSQIAVQYVADGGPGCISDTAVLIIPNVFAPAKASFSASSPAYCPQQSITFTYTGTTAVQSWLWDFGNGMQLTTASPVSQRYADSGQYQVTLRAIATNGCSIIPDTQQVRIYQPPVVDAGPFVLKLWDATAPLYPTVSDSVNYTFNWSPATGISNPNILRPTTQSPIDITYTLLVKGGPGNCQASDTVSVKVLTTLYIPSAFSPDGNGLNDVWNIPGINGNPNARVRIYNRYGQPIYDGIGYRKPWDGTYLGKPQPIGSYNYLIQPDMKKSKVYKGFVMIVR